MFEHSIFSRDKVGVYYEDYINKHIIGGVDDVNTSLEFLYDTHKYVLGLDIFNSIERIYVRLPHFRSLAAHYKTKQGIKGITYIPLIVGDVYLLKSSRPYVAVFEGALKEQHRRGIIMDKKSSMSKNQIHQRIESYDRKYYAGFTSEEIKEIINSNFPNISMEHFNNAMRGNTGRVIDGHFITYPVDLVKGIVAATEYRDLYNYEWD